MQIISLPQPIIFEWDEHNKNKILKKHRIIISEIEQAFFNKRMYWYDDLHSLTEQRYNLLGISDLKKNLHITFTIRNNKIRVISARKADKKERITHGKEAQENPQI